jgi:hypothetical protein
MPALALKATRGFRVAFRGVATSPGQRRADTSSILMVDLYVEALY